MEHARSWVTTRRDRLRICVFRGLPVPACATRLQAPVPAHTRAIQNQLLVQTHWGLCTQQEKEKQERIFPLWVSLCLLIP